MKTACRIFLAVCLCAGISLSSCTRTETIDFPKQPVKIAITDIKRLPDGAEIAYVKVNIAGAGQKVIGEIEAEFIDGEAVLMLPDEIPSDILCKVGKENPSDITGFWPAEDISDHDAKVGELKDFIVYNADDVRIGRVSLTDWEGRGDASGKYTVYFHYADRPFTLSGYNMSFSGIISYTYSASFSAGWNAYAIIKAQESDSPGPNSCTTDIPEETQLFWLFESWIY